MTDPSTTALLHRCWHELAEALDIEISSNSRLSLTDPAEMLASMDADARDHVAQLAALLRDIEAATGRPPDAKLIDPATLAMIETAAPEADA